MDSQAWASAGIAPVNRDVDGPGLVDLHNSRLGAVLAVRRELCIVSMHNSRHSLRLVLSRELCRSGPHPRSLPFRAAPDLPGTPSCCRDVSVAARSAAAPRYG